MGASTWLASSLFLRTALGELTRAIALSILLVAQRTQSIRRQYPTWRYVPAALFKFGRRLPPPFPPTRNPWTYAPRRSTDPEFNMLYTIIAMALVGSTCGGNLPMIPTWMGSLAGACLFALGCTLTDSPRGDLCRTMGMRVVALIQELWDIQAQLKIVPKAAVVSSQIIDRLMILDRQHKVKDRFLQLVNAGYEQTMKTASRVQEQRLEAQGRGKQEEEQDRRRQRGTSRDIQDRDYHKQQPSGNGDGDRDRNHYRRGPTTYDRWSREGHATEDDRSPRRPLEDNDKYRRGEPKKIHDADAHAHHDDDDYRQRHKSPQRDRDIYESPKQKKGWFGR